MDSVERVPNYDDWTRLYTDGDFEEALAALREVVECLESGDLRLDDAVHCFEIATLLSRRCQHLLDEAELRITRLSENDEGDMAPAKPRSLFDSVSFP
jgi:exodeoxyribonuclease VII small subunit